MVNHHFPHRLTTMVENPRARPTPNPQATTVRRCLRAWANAGRISGAPGLLMAKANTAFR